MRKLVASILVMLFCFTSIVYAESMGEVWNKCDKSFKYGLVTGFQAGYDFGFNSKVESCRNTEVSLAQERRDSVKNANPQTIAASLDNFYAHEANFNIPLSYAVLYVVKVMRGALVEETQDELAAIRDQFNIKNK